MLNSFISTIFFFSSIIFNIQILRSSSSLVEVIIGCLRISSYLVRIQHPSSMDRNCERQTDNSQRSCTSRLRHAAYRRRTSTQDKFLEQELLHQHVYYYVSTQDMTNFYSTLFIRLPNKVVSYIDVLGENWDLLQRILHEDVIWCLRQDHVLRLVLSWWETRITRIKSGIQRRSA